MLLPGSPLRPTIPRVYVRGLARTFHLLPLDRSRFLLLLLLLFRPLCCSSSLSDSRICRFFASSSLEQRALVRSRTAGLSRARGVLVCIQPILPFTPRSRTDKRLTSVTLASCDPPVPSERDVRVSSLGDRRQARRRDRGTISPTGIFNAYPASPQRVS